MKKYQILIYIFILFILLFVLTGCAKKDNQNIQNINNTSATRTSTNVNEEYAENRIANILQNKNEIIESSTPKETEISSYSTTIKDKAEGRLTNINITCSTLNNTIVHSGETFSFNKVVGKPTADKGYQEASIIIDHKTEKGIGRWKLPSK